MNAFSSISCRWQITFFSGDASWTSQMTGTYQDAIGHADALCYEPTTRFTVTRAD